MKNKKKGIILGVIGFILVLIIGIIIYFVISLQPVSNKSDIVTFSVNPGASKVEIASNLKNAGLVRSKLVTIAYLFFSPKVNLQAGNYELDRSSSVKDIIDKMAKGDIVDERVTVEITFVEGKKLVDYAKLISNNFDISYDEIMEVTSDKEYLNELINKYWFLTDEILNNNIYYPLEGYLAPDTYKFFKEATIKEIIEKMLDNMDKRLTSVKDDIDKSEYTVHQILTMASIAEKEAVNEDDRKGVAQVIYKRLGLNMALGMDVTTYYSVFKDMTEDITAEDLAGLNAYNTRNRDFIGLPASAICNPSMVSINAVLHPSDTDYIYFVADVNTGKVYFCSSYEEFVEYKSKLGL